MAVVLLWKSGEKTPLDSSSGQMMNCHHKFFLETVSVPQMYVDENDEAASVAHADITRVEPSRVVVQPAIQLQRANLG